MSRVFQHVTVLLHMREVVNFEGLGRYIPFFNAGFDPARHEAGRNVTQLHCLITNYTETHDHFLDLTKEDIRYKRYLNVCTYRLKQLSKDLSRRGVVLQSSSSQPKPKRPMFKITYTRDSISEKILCKNSDEVLDVIKHQIDQNVVYEWNDDQDILDGLLEERGLEPGLLIREYNGECVLDKYKLTKYSQDEIVRQINVLHDVMGETTNTYFCLQNIKYN